ncbi:MAG: hypothetical protein GY803_08075 [Chloroflexi bacterium]|nr:hypothetical protein [Chloroflexota bacterium]
MMDGTPERQKRPTRQISRFAPMKNGRPQHPANTAVYADKLGGRPPSLRPSPQARFYGRHTPNFIPPH